MSFEGRYDTEQPLQGYLASLYALRREAENMKLMVVPSKVNLQKHAQPLNRMALNKNIRTLVVDRELHALLAIAIRERSLPHVDNIEFTEHQSGVIVALDAEGQFCGSYKFSGTGAQPTPTTSVPAGQGR